MNRSINLKTPVPGPKSVALLERRRQSVARGISHWTPIFAREARGALLTDVDGNTFVDFAGGIGSMNVGHSNPMVVEAAAEQLARMTHTCFSVALYESYVRLAETLNRLTPGEFAKKTILLNSGAEAVENAVKIARHFTGRPGVIVFEHAFHGRTLLAMSMTSKVRPYKAGFGPFAPEVYRLPYPGDPISYGAVLDEFFRTHVAADNVACVVLELVAGEGGFLVASSEAVKDIEARCRENGILLVIDEVQTGLARTGRVFACEHFELEPDLLILAKSLGGGLPIAAVTGRAEIMDHVGVGGLGGTFVGNPVSCAAAVAALEYMETNDLAGRALQIGQIVEQRFCRLAQKYPFIGEARGLGAMRALEIVSDRASSKPDPERANRAVKKAYENGLILISAGTHGNVIRTLMPLVITDEQLEEGLDVLESALD